MKFCEKCNAMMNLTLDGYVCPKCGYKIQYNLDVIKIRRPEEEIPEPIYIGGGKEDSLIVQRSCPECSNPEAYQSITVTIGEHSGVKTDRSIIRYKCTKCFHVWKDY